MCGGVLDGVGAVQLRRVGAAAIHVGPLPRG
jgi:hypothetical protein